MNSLCGGILMSVEFKDQGFPGWYQDNPNKPTILRRNVATIKSISGGISPIVAEFDYATGNIQYYEVRGGIGFNGPRIPLFTQSASGARTIQNQGNLNQLKPEDIQNIEKTVKDVAFQANQKLASEKEKEDLKNSSYYKSTGNATETETETEEKNSDGPAPPTDDPPGDSSTIASYEDRLELRKIEAVSLDMDKLDIDNTRYPFEMKDMDAVLFTRKEYIPVDFNQNTVGFIRDEKNTKTKGRVILGIQPSIRDRNTVSWNGLTINMFETAVSDLFYSAAGGGSEGATSFAERSEATIKGAGGKNLRSGILSLIAQEATGTKGLTSRLTGGVFNPNLELLFQAPDLRTFDFNFNLSPRNEPEADAIKRIIKFFKQGMAVQRTKAELFLKAPHVFDIEYQLNGTSIHPSLNRIKTCALTSFSVDYTPSNSYMTFDDDLGTPVQYGLSLTFQELTPVYADDYNKGHAIGY